jgi:hypothetical protein
MNREPLQHNGKEMGDLYDSVVFVYPVYASSHLFKGNKKLTIEKALEHPKSHWSIDNDFFNYLMGRGCRLFIVKDYDHPKKVWYVEMEDFDKNGWRCDFGTGNQVRLNLPSWHLTNVRWQRLAVEVVDQYLLWKNRRRVA